MTMDKKLQLALQPKKVPDELMKSAQKLSDAIARNDKASIQTILWQVEMKDSGKDMAVVQAEFDKLINAWNPDADVKAKLEAAPVKKG